VRDAPLLATHHPICAEDWARILEAVAFVHEHDSAAALAGTMPDLSDCDRAAVARHCRFSHAGLLVFSSDLAKAKQELEDSGLRIGAMTPSTVVRARLACRYDVPIDDIDVGILRARVDVDDDGQRELEIFLAAEPPHGDLARLAAKERAAQDEYHIAFDVRSPDEVIVRGIHTIFASRGGMELDGGGYNPHEDVTVLYFRPALPGRGARVELSVRGHWTDLLRSHRDRSAGSATRDGSDAVRWTASHDGDGDMVAASAPPPGARVPELIVGHEPAVSLLRLMAGAWTTQAIANQSGFELCGQQQLPLDSSILLTRRRSAAL